MISVMRSSSLTRIGTAGATAVAEDGPPLFERLLRPKRSLGPVGFWIVIGVVGATSLFNGILFLALGAWPVFGFYGLDALLLYFLMRLNLRRAERSWETIRLTAQRLVIEHGDHRGVSHRIELQPYWLRITVDGSEIGQNRITLASHGQRVGIGGFLAPADRAVLARDLSAALDRVRGAPDPEG
jgi:uncharacterized membrane protein